MAKTYVIGGQGTGGDASANNGGAFNPAGTATYSTFQGTNGGPIATCSAGTISNAAGFVVITKAGQFATVVNNSFANCVFTGVLTSGRYEVASHTNDTITLVLSYVAGADAETADVYVGGALDTIATAKALPAAGDQFLLAGERTYTIGASWVPTTGTATAPIIIKSVNKADGTDITDNSKRAVVQPSADIVGMLDIQDASDYNHFYDIVFDGDDGGGNTADYAVYNNITTAYANNCQFYNCDFKNCDADGVYWNGRQSWVSFVNCNSFDNGAMGINLAYVTESHRVINCRISRNGTVGLYLYSTNTNPSFVCNNLITDNGTYGLQVYRYSLLHIICGNTIVNNTSDGVYIAYGTAALTNAQADNIIADNIIAYNGGYGVNAHANVTAQLYAEQIVRNNYFYGNTSGATNNTGDFFAHDSNITTTDPLFMDHTNATVASRDYRLKCTSTILHAGMQGTITGYGALNTIDFPAAGNVTEDDTVDGVTGTYHEAEVGEVQDGVMFGAASALEGEYVGGGGGGLLAHPGMNGGINA